VTGGEAAVGRPRVSRAAARRRKAIALPIYPHVDLLELDATVGFVRGLMLRGYDVCTVAATEEAIPTTTPLHVLAERRFHELPHPAMVIVVGSAGSHAIEALGDVALVEYLRSVAGAGGCELVASVGTGSLLLAAAGLLEGRTATTHWAFGRILDELGARYVRAPFHDDGAIATAAGGSGAMDLALHLLARFGSPGQAKLVQLFGEYDPEPPLGQLVPAELDERGLALELTQRRPQLAAALADHPDLLGAVDRAVAHVLGGGGSAVRGSSTGRHALAAAGTTHREDAPWQ
jgi:putative intracellular protease/amidase